MYPIGRWTHARVSLHINFDSCIVPQNSTNIIYQRVLIYSHFRISVSILFLCPAFNFLTRIFSIPNTSNSLRWWSLVRQKWRSSPSFAWTLCSGCATVRLSLKYLLPNYKIYSYLYATNNHRLVWLKVMGWDLTYNNLLTLLKSEVIFTGVCRRWARRCSDWASGPKWIATSTKFSHSCPTSAGSGADTSSLSLPLKC